jgi:hypothetical protein
MDISVQTFYSIVNNYVCNVVHPMCCYNFMLCSSFVPLETRISWCQIFYLFFICRGHEHIFHFCFMTKGQFYCEKLLKILLNGYTFTKSCCTGEVTPDLSARLGPRFLCERAMWREWVAPLSLAWLALDLLCITELWLGVTPNCLAWLLETAPVMPDRVARLV